MILATLLTGCLDNSEPQNQWEGAYIGYYHYNNQDTTQVTLVFEGNYFAAAPYHKAPIAETTGMFQSDQASLTFEQKSNSSRLDLNGPYRYEFSADGSLRCWQEDGADIRELILKEQ